MRAGQLNYILVFEEQVEVKSSTGFTSGKFSEVFRCRAYRKKQSLLSAEEVSAHEQFVHQTMVMQVRKYPQIKYGQHVRYAGCIWDIKMIEPFGNELTLTLKKIDT